VGGSTAVRFASTRGDTRIISHDNPVFWEMREEIFLEVSCFSNEIETMG
jgi:hypothetical protein